MCILIKTETSMFKTNLVNIGLNVPSIETIDSINIGETGRDKILGYTRDFLVLKKYYFLFILQSLAFF
jgi:hypothetical protein